MKQLIQRCTALCTAGIAAVALSGCVEESGTRGSSAMRDASSAAESACMSAVNSNYGGNVKSVSVVSSEFSQANSTVMVRASGVRGGADSEQWRCLVSSDGSVQDLSVVGR